MVEPLQAQLAAAVRELAAQKALLDKARAGERAAVQQAAVANADLAAVRRVLKH